MQLVIDGICKAYGSNKVLHDFSLTARQGEFVAVLGRSGCGKSTLLRVAGGFERPDAGRILLDGMPVTAPDSRMLMVFQDFHQLFPWKTLEDNIVYALKKTARPFKRARAKVLARDCIAQMGLAGFETSWPHQLSGGMKQRGALARALALRPKVLLLDEPFSSLDYFTRSAAQQALLQLWQSSGATMLFVTHDIDEAILLAQRLVVMGGRGTHYTEIVNDGDAPALKKKLETLLVETQESHAPQSV